MWRLALLAVPLFSLMLAGAAAPLPAKILGAPAPSASPAPATTTPPPTPYSTPAPPTAKAEPAPPSAPAPAINPAYPGALRPGDWVQAAGTDGCLNVRSSPSTQLYPAADADANVVNCLPDGFVARLSDETPGDVRAPMFADGHWWWQLVGQGWAAEDWLRFHHAGGLPWPQEPELGGLGLIAYMGLEGGVWLMRADGSEQRQILSADETKQQAVTGLSWSPDGGRLSFTVRTWNQSGASAVTRVVGLDGAPVAEYPGIAEARWSPDGTRLSALRVSAPGDLGGYNATPVVYDPASGAQTALGPAASYIVSPAWSPDGKQLAFTCSSYSYQEMLPDGTNREVSVDCGGDGLRLVSTDGLDGRLLLPFSAEGPVIYRNPSWSPDGTALALEAVSVRDAVTSHVLVHVASGSIVSTLPPEAAMTGGRCGGSSEDGATDWSADGRFLAYHQSVGGRGGVWLADLATGESRLAPNMSPSSVSFAADSRHLVYGGAGYIWVTTTDASQPALLTAGWLPVWQPHP